LDAIGRPPPGLSIGACHWPGSFELCMSIPEHILPANTTMASRYCTAFFKIPVPVKVPEYIHFGVDVGFCIPRSCNEQHFFRLLDSVMSRYNVEVDKIPTYCHSSPETLPKEAWFWAAIMALAFFGIPVVIATALELFIWLRWKHEVWNFSRLQNAISSDSEETESVEALVEDSGEQEVQGLLGHETMAISSFVDFRAGFLKHRGLPVEVLMTFSLPWNTWKWWAVPRVHAEESANPLVYLNGIRVITMIWIMFGHCIVFSCTVANNLFVYAQENFRRWTFQVIVSATLSVDVFFMMSGLLCVYTALPRFSAAHGLVGRARFWLIFVCHRLLRLTPAYVLTILVYAGLFHHLHDGPLFPQKPDLLDSLFCRRHGWVTYLNNLIYSRELCMGWSWYLSDDFQFSVVLAPIFISLASWNVAAGMIFAAALIISSILATFGIAYKNDYLLGSLSFADNFDTIYVKPYTRWGTYAIGLVLGWIILKQYKPPKQWSFSRNVVFSLVLLSFASVFCLSTLYGLYGYVSQTVPFPSTGVSALYTSVHRPVFILGIAIVCFLCTTGYAPPIRSLLAWTGFRPLARLTYGAYLVHPLVILFLCVGGQSPIILDNLFLVSLFLAAFALSYGFAYLLSMMTESPILACEKLFGLR
ncbi:nose resistant to fluoxetine protein 6, partial [Clonorchis sinensis]